MNVSIYKLKDANENKDDKVLSDDVDFEIFGLRREGDKDIFQIEQPIGSDEAYEVDYDWFNTVKKFCEFRLYIVTKLKTYYGRIMTKERKLIFLERWMDANKENFEMATAEELYNCPLASRKTVVSNKIEKTNSIPILITIDLTLNDSSEKKNNKPILGCEKRRKKMRENIKKSCEIIMEGENNRSKCLSKKQEIKKSKDDYFKLTSKQYHKNVNEIEVKRNQMLYQDKIEGNQCFLMALRFISSAFPLDLFANVFVRKNIDDQIKLANFFLFQRSNQILKLKMTFYGCLERLRNDFAGRFIAVFILDLELHCEGIKDHSFSKKIEKKILDRKNENFNFTLYFLEPMNGGEDDSE